MALCFDRGVLPVPLLWHAHRSAAVSSTSGERHTTGVTAVSSIADGRRTITLTMPWQEQMARTFARKQRKGRTIQPCTIMKKNKNQI